MRSEIGALEYFFYVIFLEVKNSLVSPFQECFPVFRD